MKRLILLLVVLLLAACEIQTTSTAPPRITPIPSDTVPAATLPEPTAEPSAEGPTQTPTPRPLPAERLRNGGFEGDVRPVIFPEVNVYEDWEPYYCDEPYTPEKCPAERRDTQFPAREGYNDPGLMMGRPEFKPSGEANRVHGESTAQQWFCFFRVCRSGVFQTIQTNPGEVCEVSAWVMTWSAGSAVGSDGQNFTSWVASDDDRANSTWFIKVDPDGGTFAFTPGLLISQPFTYDFGHYDRYVQIRFTFTATGLTATVFFENARLWPFPHNDSYIDDASVTCQLPVPEPTPEPTQPVSTSTLEPGSTAAPGTPDDGCDEDNFPFPSPQPGCPWPTWLPSPTPTRVSVTAAPSLDSTPTPIGTGYPEGFEATAMASVPCSWYQVENGAEHRRGYYRYTGTEQSTQNIRQGPGLNYGVLGQLPRLEAREVFWQITREGYTWYGLDWPCTIWVADLGSEEWFDLDG